MQELHKVTTSHFVELTVSKESVESLSKFFHKDPSHYW